MDKALKVINRMKKAGVIRDYAIGGAIAAMFYTEPFLTVDLDIIFIPVDEEESRTDPLSLVYAYLRERKYRPYREYIMVEGIPVQFIPIYNELVREAVLNAENTKYKNIKTRVFKPEYIIAIYVLSNRDKDRDKIRLLLSQGEIDKDLLEDILKRHGLYQKYQSRWKRHYE